MLLNNLFFKDFSYPILKKGYFRIQYFYKIIRLKYNWIWIFSSVKIWLYVLLKTQKRSRSFLSQLDRSFKWMISFKQHRGLCGPLWELWFSNNKEKLKCRGMKERRTEQRNKKIEKGKWKGKKNWSFKEIERKKRKREIKEREKEKEVNVEFVWYKLQAVFSSVNLPCT